MTLLTAVFNVSGIAWKLRLNKDALVQATKSRTPRQVVLRDQYEPMQGLQETWWMWMRPVRRDEHRQYVH